MILEYILLEFVLLAVAGFSLFWGNKGIFLAGLVVTVLNFIGNNQLDFWYWEKIVGLYWLMGITINSIFNRKTKHLRIIKVSAGSMTSFFTMGLFLPFFLGLIFWMVLIVMPLAFTYRKIPKALYLQLIFQFIFSAGWLIIGNILY